MTRTTVPGIMDMEYRYTAGQHNGRIWQSKDWIGAEVVTYTYDGLQRLASAATTGTEWGEAYSYDGFGNLTGKTPTKGSAPALSVVYNPATNQPYNGNYDANGNAPVGTWDVENRLVGQTLDGQAIAWGYDPFGKRVMRLQTVNGLPKWSFYLYDSGGRRLAQFGCAAGGGVYTYCVPYTVAAEGTETYFGGKLIASTDANGHLLGATDRLGTVRGVQTNGGAWAQPTYFPYGEPRTAGGVDGKEQFATYVRDSTASAQDYAGARYYSNVTGRFSSPDPGGVKTANPRNPGSWNRYAYVNGDPVNFADPTGTDSWFVACGKPVFGPPDDQSLGDWECFDVRVQTANLLMPEYTPEGGGGGGGGRDWCNRNDVTNAKVLDFIAANKGAADSVAASTGLGADFILAWAGYESGYGTSPAATKDNNFYGLKPALGSSEVHWAGSDPYSGCAVAGYDCFTSQTLDLAASATSALTSFGGKYLAAALGAQGAGGGAAAIAQAIADAEFNSEYGPGIYGGKVNDAFQSIQLRKDCPQ